MNAQDIKLYLKDNPELIEDILENVGCHHIKLIKNKRVQSALPYPSDNPTSVQILLNDNLNTKVYTKNDFNKYEIKDIFSLVQYIKNCSLIDAINLICKTAKIEYKINNNKKTSESYSFLKKYKRSVAKEEFIGEEIFLPNFFSQRFVREDCVMFLNDGVNSDTQEKFGVSFDVLDNRIVFPIKNEEGRLLSFKGRTCEKDYKTKGIPKFISYYPCSNNNYLFGLYENHNDISKEDEIILVEAEKGVMQLYSMGIKNALAINKKMVSDIQVRKLLKLGKSIVFAFDKDVTLEEIYIECKKFNGLCDIYYIYDTMDLLKGKESPTDKGFDIFNILYNECKFKYKGE